MEDNDKPKSKRLRGKANFRFYRKLNWSDRYGKDYRKTCRKAHTKARQLCCVCFVRKSEEIHHAVYGQLDIPGVHVFPCCKTCHSLVCHSDRHWIKDKFDPVWGNRNTKEFSDRLQLGFEILNKGVC